MTVGAPTTAVFGTHEEQTIQQLENCLTEGNVARAALMADGHFGYSQPIGGVVGYRGQISPSGVGYDIACGNKAVRTHLTWSDIENDLPRIADEVARAVSFGLGRKTKGDELHSLPLFDDDRWSAIPVGGRFEGDKPNAIKTREELRTRAREQLGTVGSGNHYVDIFVEGVGFMYPDRTKPMIAPDSRVWIGVHFGSRGFGYNTAAGFLKMAHDVGFFDRPGKGELPQDTPTVLDIGSTIGDEYVAAMGLAGDYAYAGRDFVVQQVLDILGTTADYEVHNHHNFAWEEEHFGEKLWVVRKGATPMWPGQESFIGGSMADIAVIARGNSSWEQLGELSNGGPVFIDTPPMEYRDSLMSSVHGAGRIMGRMVATGKRCKECKDATKAPGCEPCAKCSGTGWQKEPQITPEMMRDAVAKYAPLELRGAGLDETPYVYRRLDDVLRVHTASTQVLHTLRPVVVCMAGADEFDPFKD